MRFLIPLPEPPMATTADKIGEYFVHPAAALFPLLADDDTDFETLKDSIKEYGQLVPIVVQGNWLLDGRNRLRACLAAGVVPCIEEYCGHLLPSEVIAELNLSRRDLTPELRALIVGQIYVMMQDERKALAQKAAGVHGIKGGRGHKKTLETNPSPGFTQAKDARSTIGQVARKADVSMHIARLAFTVAKHAPDLVPEVRTGRMELHIAEKQARERMVKSVGKPKRARLSFQQVQERLLSRIRKVCSQFPHKRDQLIRSMVITAASLYTNYWVHRPRFNAKDQGLLEFKDCSQSYIEDLSRLLRNAVIEHQNQMAA